MLYQTVNENGYRRNLKPMIKAIFLLLLISISFQLNSQTLSAALETIDPNITWPWNWDIASDQNRLVTVNENGTLNIKNEGNWDILEIDPENPDLEPRGVAIAEDGSIWFTTTEHGLWKYDTNKEFSNYNSSNSFLPVDKLRSLAIHEDVFWISTDGLGLIRHDFDSDETTYFTTDQYDDLKSDVNLDPYIDGQGNMWFSNRECVSKITPELEWTNEDMRFHISGGNVTDMHIESDSAIWMSMFGGLVFFDGSDYNVVLQNQFHTYLRVLKDSRGDVWLSRLSTLNGDGITVIRDNQTYFFNMEDYPDLPNQVFEFIEHQDTVIAVGTIGNTIAKLVFDISTSVIGLEEPSLVVYPNPASNVINVKSDQTIEHWSISEIMGREILKSNLSPQQIDISQLNTGLYLLSFKTKNGIVSKKVTIANKQ